MTEETSADLRDARYVAQQMQTNTLIMQYRARMQVAREKLHRISLDVSAAFDVMVRAVEIPVPSIDCSRSTPRLSGSPPSTSSTMLVAVPAVDPEGPTGSLYHFARPVRG